MKIIKENKGIMISGILLILLSVGFTAVINFECFYDRDVIQLIAYFVRAIIRVGAGIGVFIVADRYGRGVVQKFGWIFVPAGSLICMLLDSRGNISVYNYSIEMASFASVLAVLGLATYFYGYCTKSVIHTVVFWGAGFVFLAAGERPYLTMVLFVMIGMMLLSSYKNKLIGKRSVWIINAAFYVLLLLGTADEIIQGIVRLSQYSSDRGYMAYIAGDVYSKTVLFGTNIEPAMIGGNVKYYKLLWIFGVFGIIAGLAAFAALTSFVFFVCKKGFKVVLSDTTPIAYAAASIILVRYVVSMLTNFGVVLYGVFAPIPVFSDGLFGYAAIFMLLGLMLGKEKVDIHSKRYGFAGRLSNFTKREFVFDDVKCQSIEGVLQSFKCKDSDEQKSICMLFGIDAKNAGTDFDWKTEQKLYWKGTEYKRDSIEYEMLINRLYETVYMCDSSFRKDIVHSNKYILDHSIGVEDKAETVLTKKEFISNLKMLQGRD